MTTLRHLATFVVALATAAVLTAVGDGVAELFGLTHMANLPPWSPLVGPGFAMIAWFGALSVLVAASTVGSRQTAGGTVTALAGAAIGAAGGWLGVASAARPSSWYDLFTALGSSAALGVLGGLVLLRVDRRFVATGALFTLAVAWLVGWYGLAAPGGGLDGRRPHAAVPGTVVPVGLTGGLVVATLYAIGLSLVVRAARRAGVPPFDSVVAALIGPVLAVLAIRVPPNLDGGAGRTTGALLIVLVVGLVTAMVAATTRPVDPLTAEDTDEERPPAARRVTAGGPAAPTP